MNLIKRLRALPPKQALLLVLQEKEKRTRQRRFYAFYPDTGPLRRELYPKSIEFFRLGKIHRERLLCAANRYGKTEGVGGYELVAHMTGDYPKWWPGRRFERPVRCWAAGDTAKTVRGILQRKILGPMGQLGTGILPGALLGKTTPKSGVPDAIDTFYAKHLPTGKWSTCELKSYDQRREGFQGDEVDVALLDEEPPDDVYDEVLIRTAETPERPGGGMVILTYTPLKGLTPLTLRFLPEYAPEGDEDLEPTETYALDERE